MAWTEITTAALQIGKPGSAGLLRALFNNFRAMANGDSGAPKIQNDGIADGAVTALKLGTGAVVPSKIALNAVGAGHIGAGQVSNRNLSKSLGPVVQQTIAAGAVFVFPAGIYVCNALQTAADANMAASLDLWNELTRTWTVAGGIVSNNSPAWAGTVISDGFIRLSNNAAGTSFAVTLSYKVLL